MTSASQNGHLRWPTVQLSDVADHCLGKMLDAKKNKGRPLPYLRNPDVRWLEINTTQLRTMPFEPHEDDRYSLQKGDVVICEGGEAGRAAIWDGRLPNVKFQKAIHRVRPGPKLDAKYLVYCIMTDYQNGQLADYYTGATIKHLTGQDIARYRFQLPPLQEQRRIAEILDKADALRAKRRAALAQLEALTQSIFLDMFGDPVTNPKGWPASVTLGEVAEIVSGVTKGRNLQGKVSRMVPYLAVSNVQDRALDLSITKRIEATEEEIQRYQLQADDLLLTEGGDPDKLGRGTLWNNELPECIHQNHIFRVRLTTEAVTPLFLNWLVGGQRGKRYFLRSAKQTTGIASINMTQLKGFPLLLPPLALQHEFARHVAIAQKLKAAHRASLAELDALFASLQHRAFRGEL
ncbi:restriction endonuclease subunit S [Candidatus Accumulibacter sp. ACC003]|uniref:restriction endonuclease subunit S n=1 Tax=Candidatus Accumulibacter sp. ACC003 TaxID=2823334 RepID=UPI0025B8A02F|nr:restriction endonuclease subunit S [Candidatus Accumulibacter sp. ACC003]